MPPNPATVPADVYADKDFALGVYINRFYAERYYRYENGAPSTIAGRGRSLNVGLLLAGSVVTLSDKNTLRDSRALSGGEVPMLTFTPAVGLGAGYGDVTVNAFFGKEWGFGSAAGAWDYQGAWWLGFGITAAKLPF